MKTKTILLTLLVTFVMNVSAKDYTIKSPDGQLQITIHANADKLTWEIRHGATIVLTPSEIGLNGHLTKMSGKVVKNTAVIRNKWVSVEFRADNDAAAYRMRLLTKKPSVIKAETAEFNFDADYNAFIPYVNDNRGGERWCYSFESYYDEQPLSKMFKDSLAINPLAVRLPDNKLAVIADMDATDYPGMMLLRHGTHHLRAAFAPYPLEEEIGGFNRLNLVPTKRADYIAKFNGAAELPWRIVLVTTNDAQLLSANGEVIRVYPELPTIRLTKHVRRFFFNLKFI